MSASVPDTTRQTTATRPPRVSAVRRRLLRLFHAAWRLDEWLRRRFTGAGVMMLGMMLLGVVFGVNTRVSLAYQIAVLGFAFVLVGLVWAPWFRPRVVVARDLPRHATVGIPVDYHVTVTNRGRRSLRGALLLEHVPSALPTDLEILRGARGADARRGWFDRRVGYPRFAALVRGRRGVDVVPAVLPDLAVGASVTVRLRLTPTRRGAVRLAAIDLLRPDPLGIFLARHRVLAPGALVVLPARHRVPAVEAGAGEHTRTFDASVGQAVGGADEFASLREYRPGDPLRNLDWKGWARHGAPVVREFHEETSAREAVLLDRVLPATAGLDRFEAAVRVAASTVGATTSRAGPIALILAGGTLERVQSEPLSMVRPLEALAFTTPELAAPAVPTDTALGKVLDGVTRCTCVLLDWDAPRRRLVARLRAQGITPLVLVVGEGERAGAPLDPGPMADLPELLRRLDGAGPAPEPVRG
ncbi:MAG: DUF58 domain-containing protein [Ectothiorhodospiraceae bacterium]|nr:DUF58 domain-containing protein [Chromatiales bacterium]MCP5153817.1 DUF58 domain-containing protein [Ectothiorhodospiraceae bacterium]